MVLERICLKIQRTEENAPAFSSEHQNCEKNLTYVKYEVEINIWNILQKQNWRFTSF